MSYGFILDRLSDPVKRASERNECDPQTDRMLHDDLVISTALCAPESGELPIYKPTEEEPEELRKEEEKWERRQRRWLWEHS